MKGCILDAGSLGPEVDLSPILTQLDSWSVWQSTKGDEISARIDDVDVVLSNKIPLQRPHLAAAKQLRYISVLATGTNNIDLAAASDYGIKVSNVRHYSTASVVQHTVSLMLALASNLLSYVDEVKQQKWQESPFFCHFNRAIVELSGKVLTIVGHGSQGQRLVQVAAALGMEVRIARRPGASDDPRPSLDELLPVTDVLSLHCPLTPATIDLVHIDNIFRLKKGALLINCARGGLVNEEALVVALQRDHLGGAAIDVVTTEPLPPGHPYLQIKHPNFILTPHIAWASREARQRLIDATAENIRAFLRGEPPPI